MRDGSVSGRASLTCCRQSGVYLDESITDMQTSVGLGTSAQDYCPFKKILQLFMQVNFI